MCELCDPDEATAYDVPMVIDMSPNVNTIIGRRVSSEGLDWGLFSVKRDHAGRQEDYDDHDHYYWDSYKRQTLAVLRQFGVEWEPDLVF